MLRRVDRVDVVGLDVTPQGGWRWVPLGDSLSRVSHMYYGMPVLHVCCPVEFCVFAGCYWFCCLCVVRYWLCVSLVFVNCFFCVMKNPCVCFAGVQRFVFAVYIGFMSDLGGVRYSFCGWWGMDFFIVVVWWGCIWTEWVIWVVWGSCMKVCVILVCVLVMGVMMGVLWVCVMV